MNIRYPDYFSVFCESRNFETSERTAAFDRCKFKGEMYMGFSVEDVVWEVIEDYDELGEMFK